MEIDLEIVCCICDQIKIDGNWKKQKTANHQKLSHGYCPSCFKNEIKKFAHVLYRGERNTIRVNHQTL